MEHEATGNAGKTQLVLFGQCNNTGAIDMKIYGSVLEEKSYFKMLGLTFWIGALTLTLLLKLSLKTVLILSMEFLSPEVALYLYISTMRPCMEYFCHIWASAPSY